jgi:hypothetical protein
MNQHICHNPACHTPVAWRDAFVRSVSLQQVVFCSRGCVRMFDELDAVRGHHFAAVGA